MAETGTHKARTHARILDEAAAAMRLHGSGGISVAGLMQRAGLTHGGFYAHFKSRDELVAHAIDRMFEDCRGLVDRNLGMHDPARGLAGLIDSYLSDFIRSRPELGCPLPGLTAEVPRMPAAARARFNQGVARFEEALADALAALGKPEPASLARSVLAEMVGAMSLARAAADEASGSDILRSSRRSLKGRLGLEPEPAVT